MSDGPPRADWAAPDPATAGRPTAATPSTPSTPAAWMLAAQIGLLVAGLSAVYFGYAVAVERRALVDVRDGERLTLQRIDDVDNLVSQASIANVVGYLVAGVAFIGWFFQSYRSLSRRRSVPHKVGWAIGGWFVPFLNFWRPYQIARVLAAPSRRDSATPTRWLPIWWTLWVSSLLVSRVANRMERGDTLDDVIRADAYWIAYSVLSACAAGAAIVVVRKIARAEAASGV